MAAVHLASQPLDISGYINLVRNKQLDRAVAQASLL